MTPLLQIRNVHIQRARETVLKISELEVENNETLAVIGPNGAGKSTLLLSICGLLPPSTGEFYFHGQKVDPQHSLAYRRKLALVLQDPLLLQSSVYQNIAAGLRFRGLPEKEIRQRVCDWLERLNISHLKDRQARQISGGEAQRVALARALVLQPDLLLLDEPFSALDSPTRMHLLEDLKRLLDQPNITTIFITHDLDEALLLGQRVAVIMNGELKQVGAPQKVFSAPADPQIAAFVGVETVIAGVVSSAQEGLLEISAGDLRLQATGDALVGQSVFLCLRPEDLTLFLPEAGGPSSARNRIRGRIQHLLPQGPLLRVVLDGPVLMVALITRASANEMALHEGQEVTVAFKASAAHIIRR